MHHAQVVLRFRIPLRGGLFKPAAGFGVVLRDALASGAGRVIECAIATDELVRPMVNGGSDITEFVVD